MAKLRDAKVIALLWDRAAAVGCMVAAIVAVVSGYVGLSDRVNPADQLPYIMSGGIGALLLIGIGATLWLSADLRDEWRKLDVIGETLRELAQSGQDTEADSVVVVAPEGDSSGGRDAAIRVVPPGGIQAGQSRNR